MASTIHEFGHVYYDRHLETRSFYWDKNENLKYIQKALDINQGNISDINHFRIRVPSYKNISELFAFCTDNAASKIFFKDHYENIRKESIVRLPNLLEEESKVDIVNDKSLLSDPHEFAMVFRSIIFEKYGNNWVDKLLEVSFL